jgi:hypothetical protein
MYYPYLRGKQFDLAALQALILSGRLSKKVVPIIEPVRDSRALQKTVNLFQQEQHPLYIVKNPLVGTFRLFDDWRYPWEIEQNSSIKTAQIVTSDWVPLPKADLFIVQDALTQPQVQLLKASHVPIAAEMNPHTQPFGSLADILLRDAFTGLEPKEAYPLKDDYFFTDDYLFYQADLKKGFGDYTIEKSKYFDKGRPGLRIVLSLTYFDAYGNLRLKHFSSDSNEDSKNQANKFFEALAKLACWVSRNQDQLFLTQGLTELLTFKVANKFPGLGIIKKWSLAHHLELMSRGLDYGENWRR